MQGHWSGIFGGSGKRNTAAPFQQSSSSKNNSNSNNNANRASFGNRSPQNDSPKSQYNTDFRNFTFTPLTEIEQLTYDEVTHKYSKVAAVFLILIVTVYSV
jgi:hypothetical protein